MNELHGIKTTNNETVENVNCFCYKTFANVLKYASYNRYIVFCHCMVAEMSIPVPRHQPNSNESIVRLFFNFLFTYVNVTLNCILKSNKY